MYSLMYILLNGDSHVATSGNYITQISMMGLFLV